MPKLDLGAIEERNVTDLPAPFAAVMAKRHIRQLGPQSGLTEFGVSHVRIEPGGISSQRHWHDKEDEFVVILDGEAVLIEDEGETLMRAGDCAVFAKGVANAHRLVNRSDSDCVVLAVGSPEGGDCHYPDIDLHWDGTAARYLHKDGTPWG